MVMLWCGPRRPSPSDVLYLATTKCSGYGDSVSTFSIIAEYRTKVMREGKDVWIFMFSHFRLGSVPKGNVWFFFFFYFFSSTDGFVEAFLRPITGGDGSSTWAYEGRRNTKRKL